MTCLDPPGRCLNSFRQIKLNYRRRITNVFVRLLFKILHLHCSELCNVKLHCITKLWCDGYNLDVI